MGSWSSKSCSNDDVLDCLDSANVDHDNPTQMQVDKVIKETFADKRETTLTKLGVVIWVLMKGLKVNKNVLKDALLIANYSVREDVVYEQEWNKPSRRIQAVKREIKLIQSAIDNNGVSNKKLAEAFKKTA